MADSSEQRPYLLRILGTWGVFLLIAVVLTVRLGPIPPLGDFLSPATGYLASARSASKKTSTQKLQFPGIKGQITISVDVRGVPHVVADDDVDLAFGQGFATARDRLWQMELQTAATAGRVSEILGAKAVEFDIKQRKLGFLAAAEAEIEFIKNNDPNQFAIIQAYSDGVNAFIASMSASDWPIEYKLLGTAPEPWTPLKCALFHKQMIWTLTGHYDDFKMTNALQRFSHEELEFLFPDFYLNSTPIVDATIAHMSTSTSEALESHPLPLRLDGLLKIADKTQAAARERKSSNGSNNWVVDGLKTNHGYPVLANDPHLDLKLPSIWYEIQLTAPGINTYGVSLPGLPHIIIGFNDSVSWGITNAGVDVTDWYAMKFDKSKPTPKYLFGQEWKSTTLRSETIRIKGQPARRIDVTQTHLGPVAHELELEQKNGDSKTLSFALKWTGHAPSNEFKVFHALNRARSVNEMKNALKDYHAPGQNFVMADKTGSIGYLQAGRFPNRTAGFGRYILDGSIPANEWKKFIPFAELPQSWAPERGWMSSANQQPTRDPVTGYASGDWGFTSYLRGARISQVLQSLMQQSPVSLSALMDLQNDVVDLRAETLLPLFIRWTEESLTNDNERRALAMLKGWNYELNSTSQEAALWSEWWDTFYTNLWEKAFPAQNFLMPSDDRTMELLLSQNSSDWPVAPSIPKRSDVPRMVANAFVTTVQSLSAFSQRSKLTTPFPRWGDRRTTDIPHLANLSGFGFEKLQTGGNGHTVNATTDHHGPSWRMVVTWFDAQPRAWGIYPGGASGEVGSPFYSNMITPWLKGELQELLYAQDGLLKESLTLSQTQLEGKP